MACFLVPAAEAIVTTIVKKAANKNNKENQNMFVANMGSLNKMLWGGSALLAFEHLWHGEITPWFPFLTAASNPADLSNMLLEMSTSGVAMAVLVTVFWACLVAVSSKIKKPNMHTMRR